MPTIVTTLIQRAWIALALAPTLCIAQSPLYLSKDEPHQHQISALPFTERKAIFAAIEPALWDHFADVDDADTMEETIHHIEGSLRYTSSTINGHRITLLESRTSEGCDAVGNCLFLVLDGHTLLLPEPVWAVRVSIRAQTHDGKPDILVSGHLSSSETTQDVFTFADKHYRKERCSIDTQTTSGIKSKSVTCTP